MLKRQCRITWALLIVLVAGWPVRNETLAQENAGDGGLRAGIGLHFDLSDNLFDSSNQEVESWASRVSPELSLSSAPGPRQLAVLYSGDYGRFFDSQDDDYADHTLAGRGLFETGSRGSLDVSASFAQTHEGRGNRLTQGLSPDSPEFPSEPDESERIDWLVQYAHGREGARGRLNFGIGENALEYSNNRDRTQFFDRDQGFASVGLTIGLQERTSFVMEARYADTIYHVDRPGEASREGDSWRVLIGLTWEATAKTEGSIRVGTQRRDFDDPSRSGQRAASWDVAIRWLPREYSYFDFVAARANQETIAEGDYIDHSSYGISWTREWAFGLESELKWDRREDDFVGTNRKQDESLYYFGLRLPQGERVIWEAGVSRRDRSTGGEIEYLEFDGMIYTMGVNLQLIR